MKFRMPGATAIAAALVAIAAPAPLAFAPAFAQPGTQPPPITKQMVTPMNEARNAVLAKDWPTAKAKLAVAAPFAKTPVDTAALERLRLVIASETGDPAQQLKSINALLASGQLTPDEIKQYKGAMGKVLLDTGDTAGSLAADRAFVDEYGGTPDQLITIANNAAKANDFATAATYAEKAIAKAKETGKPSESWYRLQLRAVKSLNQMDKYYALEETLVAEFPAGPNTEAYWKDLVIRAQEAPAFGGATKLDMFRALVAAGVKLTPNERSLAADEALKRGLPNDALNLLEPASAELTTEFDKTNLASAKSQVASDKAGLAKETTSVLAKGDGAAIASIGEAQLSYGDNAKAIEVLQAALAKGISDPGEQAVAKLHLGIAQYRAGQKDAARATWAEVKSDNGAESLAATWTVISKLK